MRVVLAEDNALLRDGIVLLLTEHRIDVAAAVDNADDLLTAVAEHEPELAILDVRMPPTHSNEGVWAAVNIRTNHPAPPYSSSPSGSKPTMPASSSRRTRARSATC
jgi:DNA-binding NarL/FixJ family response regulator